MPGEKDLHPYQKFCVDFLEEKPQCALFLDCGLGKTIITLTAISHLLYDSYEVSRVLIIAPLRVARDTWIGELSKWEHLNREPFTAFIATPCGLSSDLCAPRKIPEIFSPKAQNVIVCQYPPVL